MSVNTSGSTTMIPCSIRKDIISLATNFLQHCSIANVSTKELTQYVLGLIFYMYNRSKYRKYIYAEIVDQFLSEHFRFLNDTFTLQPTRKQSRQ